MDLSHPMMVVTPTLDGDVLKVLAGADTRFTSGQVHRVLDGERSPAGIRRTLERLTEQGIVNRQVAGRTYLYSLNRDHLAAEAIIMLVFQRDELIRRLHAEVESWEHPPIYGAIFGSGARRDHTVESDLDIFLVAPAGADPDTWLDNTFRLMERATAWTGNDARVIDTTEEEISGPEWSTEFLRNVADDAVKFIGEFGWLRDALRAARYAGRRQG